MFDEYNYAALLQGIEDFRITAHLLDIVIYIYIIQFCVAECRGKKWDESLSFLAALLVDSHNIFVDINFHAQVPLFSYSEHFFMF